MCLRPATDMGQISIDAYAFEKLKDSTWKRVELREINGGDWFRYRVKRGHEQFGLMYQAAEDARPDPDAPQYHCVRAARVAVDRSRMRL